MAVDSTTREGFPDAVELPASPCKSESCEENGRGGDADGIQLPRVRDASATRAALLYAARRNFAQKSYETVSLREISCKAGVDVALVSRYFGSKEGLFREALSCGTSALLLSESSVQDLADLLSKASLDTDQESLDCLSIIARSASSAEVSHLVRDRLYEALIVPMEAAIAGDDCEARASLAAALLLGMATLRMIMTASPKQAQRDGRKPMSQLETRLSKLFQVALTEDLRQS